MRDYLRIGYFADGPWAHRAFEKISKDDSMEIVFICIRYQCQDTILRNYGEKYGIPVLIDKDINGQAFYDNVKQYQADLFVSMSFDQIFKRRLIELPAYGTINCHAGKLPFYRGRNVLNWVLINDEKEFGITVHYIDEGIDTGNIILQETYPITDADTYGTLLERAYAGCADVLYRALLLLQSGNIQTVRQADIDPVGMYCGMRKEGDEILDWCQTSREVFNFVRAITDPGPMAYSVLNGKGMKIKAARMVTGAHVYKGIAGQVLGKTADGFLVKTADTMIEIVAYEYEGHVRVGDRFV